MVAHFLAKGSHYDIICRFVRVSSSVISGCDAYCEMVTVAI